MHAYAICYRMAGLWQSWTSTVGVCPRLYGNFTKIVHDWRCLQTHPHTHARTHTHTHTHKHFVPCDLNDHTDTNTHCPCFYPSPRRRRKDNKIKVALSDLTIYRRYRTLYGLQLKQMVWVQQCRFSQESDWKEVIYYIPGDCPWCQSDQFSKTED